MKYIVILLMAFTFFGCDIADLVKDVQEMGEKQEKIDAFIKEKYGWSSQIGWHIQNDVLTNVEIIFSAEEVRDIPVSKLEAAAKEAVSEVFHLSPQSLLIKIQCDLETTEEPEPVTD